MISEEEALAQILAAIQPASAHRVALTKACGRFVREEFTARIPIPRFDNSAMDGYAINDADCGQTVRWLTLDGEQAAGQPSSFQVAPGRAVRVFTGAALPQGTAAVVMQEDAEVSANGLSMRVNDAAEKGSFIRLGGEDAQAGAKILDAGELLSPQKIALLAAQGFTDLQVGPRPSVGILTTGDELIPAGSELPHAAAIYDSNGPMLAALLERLGIHRLACNHTADQLDAVTAAIEGGLADHDVLLIAGGVSVGARDYVKNALERLGINPLLWRVAVKPGMPLLFGRSGNKLIFGLPGNPVSAFVTFSIFVVPALLQWQGASQKTVNYSWARLGQPVTNGAKRPHYLRGRVDPEGILRLAKLQESHALFSLSQSNALLRVSPHASLPAGEVVPVLKI
ncbi:MAG: molybdopterin molybdotransferase MoeA [Verrucomicrobiales bacterium]